MKLQKGAGILENTFIVSSVKACAVIDIVDKINYRGIGTWMSQLLKSPAIRLIV